MNKQTISEALEVIGYEVVSYGGNERLIMADGEIVGFWERDRFPIVLQNASDKQYRQINHLHQRMLEGRLVYG